jgi:DNA methylase
MFPESFAAKHIEAFTKKDDYVFDPFCGRGTTILQSLLMHRNGAGIDTNPVAYCVSSAKARVPPLDVVLDRIDALEQAYAAADEPSLEKERRGLPEFFRYAYRPTTLACLLFLRASLQWRKRDVDRFVAALVLGSLHGETDKSNSYLSNQMPRTISTKPRYSIQYWKTHRLRPPRRDVFGLLRARTHFRLSTGVPERDGAVSLGDARDSGDVFGWLHGRVKAVVTSPPYLNVTRYEEDQWLRLWFLGHHPQPTYSAMSRDDRHGGQEKYWEFLSESWEGIAPLLARGAVLVCRLAGKNISRKELTENLHDSILSSFPRAYMVARPEISKIRNRQTRFFRPGAVGCFFEIDYAFKLT